MRLSTDDDIWRFQGRLYEVRGWVLPVHARYTAWGLFAAALIPAVIAAGVIPGPWWFGTALGAGLAVSAGWFAADWVAPETPLLGRLQTARVETRTWVRHRARTRPPATRTVNAHTIRKAP